MKLTEREKAYHDGYEQGRFDEYAERMGYDQAEKLKAKIDKQKNCPYCHEGETFSGELGWVATIRKFDSRIIAVSPTEEVCVLNVDYCPMCGLPLNEEEE